MLHGVAEQCKALVTQCVNCKMKIKIVVKSVNCIPISFKNELIQVRQLLSTVNDLRFNRNCNCEITVTVNIKCRALANIKFKINLNMPLQVW